MGACQQEESGRKEGLVISDPVQFGKYRLVGQVGRGGMAELFLAVAQGPAGFNKLVVLKRIWPQLAQDEQFVSMFLDEARLLARLNHPNVVHTYEVGSEQGQYFIAMEHVDGQSLRHIVKRFSKLDSFPLVLQARILVGVLAGLHYAHELCDFDGTKLNIVHQDITPENILVTYEGVVKIVDFGIANSVASLSQTKSGVLKGKLPYMAPECVRSERVDRRADIFAVGVILWEALAKRRMWGGSNELQVVQKLATGEIPPLDDATLGSPELLRICRRALEPVPAARYQTAWEMQVDLENALVVHREEERSWDLGGLVAETFATERARVRQRVDGELAQLRSGKFAVAGDAPLLMASEGDSPLIEVTARATPAGNLGQRLAGTRPLTTTPPPLTISQSGFDSVPAFRSANSRRSRRAVVLLAALGAGFFLYREGVAPRMGQTEITSALPEATAVAAAATSLVHLEWDVTPSEGKLFLDDTLLGSNPYSADVVDDGKEHLLRGEAPGFESQSKAVRFGRSEKLHLQLTRLAPELRDKAAVKHEPSTNPYDNVHIPSAPKKRTIDQESPYEP